MGADGSKPIANSPGARSNHTSQATSTKSTISTPMRQKAPEAATCNVVIIGPKQSGKTSLINLLVFKRGPEETYGAKDAKQQFHYSPNKYRDSLKLNMIEIENSDNKIALDKQFEQDIDLLIVTYDLSNESSLQQVAEQIKKYSNNYHIPSFQEATFKRLVIMGTKSDIASPHLMGEGRGELESEIEQIQSDLLKDAPTSKNYSSLEVNFKDAHCLEQIETHLDAIFHTLEMVGREKRCGEDMNKKIRQVQGNGDQGGICTTFKKAVTGCE